MWKKTVELIAQLSSAICEIERSLEQYSIEGSKICWLIHTQPYGKNVLTVLKILVRLLRFASVRLKWKTSENLRENVCLSWVLEMFLEF